MLQPQARSLFLQLEFSDARTQRVQRALQLHALLVAGAQLCRQTVVFAAPGGQHLFTFQLQRQHVLQTTLRSSVGQALQLALGTQALVRQSRGLAGRCGQRPLQFSAARLQAALRKRGLLRLALQAALLLAALVEAALGLHHALVQLCMALLRVGQLHVELFKARLGRHAALLQVGQLRFDLGQVGANLFAARAGLLHQLRQPQVLHLQRMRLGLGFGGFAAQGREALGAIGVGCFGTCQGIAGLVCNQRLGAHFLVQVLDFLRTRQQAGLLGVLCIKRHAVLRDGMSTGQVNGFARLQLAAAGQGIVQRGRGVTALQPVAQHGAQAGVVQPQQICQARQAARRGRQHRCRSAKKRQFGRRRVARASAQKTAHAVQSPYFQRSNALAQGRFQCVFPTRLDMDAAPQALQAVQPVLG